MPEEVTAELKKVIRKEADIIYADMWQNAPFDYDSSLKTPTWKKIGLTGGEPRLHLKDALRVSITLKGLRARIGIIGPKNAAKYGKIAKWVEFGTKRSDKNPFILNAYKFQLPTSRVRIREAINKALKTISRWTPSDSDADSIGIK